jgi:hypothetical protein
MLASFNHLKNPQRLIKTLRHEISLSIYFTRRLCLQSVQFAKHGGSQFFTKSCSHTKVTTIQQARACVCAFYFQERTKSE